MTTDMKEANNDMALRSIELCAGYGGFTLGLRDYGVSTVAYVERDSYAASILVARMEEKRLDQAPVWDDLCTFDGTAWRGRVDLITAGFPCQPFSTAGKQEGVDDDRWLWPDIAKIVADVGPSYVFLENVTGLIRAGLPHVLADLADLGFDAEWGVLSAADVGAPHLRKRVWILAHADSEYVAVPEGHRAHAGLTRPGGCGFPSGPNVDDGPARYGPQPAVRRGPDGRPAGLADALHLGGNGLVPATAAEAFKQLLNRADIGPS